MVSLGGSQKPREHVSALQVLLKPTITYGKGRARIFHPIIKDWGGAWAVSNQVKVVPEPKHG
jgi:hypothetical protein